MINHKRRRRGGGSGTIEPDQSLNIKRLANLLTCSKTLTATCAQPTMALLITISVLMLTGSVCVVAQFASQTVNDYANGQPLVPLTSSSLSSFHLPQQPQIQLPLASSKISTSGESLAPSSSSSSSSAAIGTSGARLRTPRSIGEMFKKLFTGNKRSKQAQSNRNEWTDQQQIQQQQQQQQVQQQQQQQQLQQQQAQQMAAAQMAAAAASQHAVYASPFATYSPQSTNTMYAATPAQFAANPYGPSGAGALVAWPTAAATANHLAQALRATPNLLATPSAPMALANSPLYAAASQTYNSYVQPPTSQQAHQAATVSGSSGQQQSSAMMQQNGSSAAAMANAQLAAAMAAASAGQPQAAASYAHPSAVAPPPGMGVGGGGNGGGGGGNPNSVDFHQVLDALVRTSGFAPAGDQEAAAAQGYSSKSDATPVFSFKKLVSFPFYLSTEEKSLDNLANAVAPSGSGSSSGAGGYSLHPMLRRHVRRMSTPTSQAQHVQQQQLAAAQSLGNFMESQLQRSGGSGAAPSERAQQQHYTNYFNALNNQLANSQLMQYFSSAQQQQSQQQTNPMSSYLSDQSYSASSPEVAAALANYQASLSSQPSTMQEQQQQQQQQHQFRKQNQQSQQMAMAASMSMPMAVQAPQGFMQQQQLVNNNINNQMSANHQRQYEEQQDIQSLLNSLQQAGASGDLAAYSNILNGVQSASSGSQMPINGSQQQQQLLQQSIMPSGGSSGSGISSSINTNGNQNQNQNNNNYMSQLDYAASSPISSAMAPSSSISSSPSAISSQPSLQSQSQTQTQPQSSSSPLSSQVPTGLTASSSAATATSGQQQIINDQNVGPNTSLTSQQQQHLSASSATSASAMPPHRM